MTEPSYRVLVVEDDPLVQKMVIAALRQKGHRAEACGDGRQALEKIEQERFDVVLTDFRMPNMTGLALIKSLQARPDRMAIVLMSSNTLEEMGVSARDLAGVEFLRKPFGLTDLHRTLQRAIKSVPPPGKP